MSIVSGTAIAEALASNGHAVEQVLIDLDGRWWWLPADHRREGREPAAYDDPRALGATGPETAGAALDRLRALDPRPVVFVALHGPFGEDGTVQALLEAAGLAYTGSGVTASAIGMDKAVFKRLVAGDRAAGRRLARGPRRRAGRASAAAVLAELEAFAAGTGDPRLMVKPSRLGSSVGMTLAHGPDEYAAALDEAFRYDTVALAEAYLAGARDLEVSVIGNDHARLELYGPGEIVAGHEFYDYAAKYTPGLSEIVDPRGGLDPDAGRDPEDRPRRLPGDRRRGLRPDRLPVRGDDLFLSEINTIPGFTPISLFPTMPADGRLLVRRRLREGRRPRARAPRGAGRRRRSSRATCRDDRPTRAAGSAGPDGAPGRSADGPPG